MSENKELGQEQEIEVPEEQTEQYSFLRETIKTRQANKLKFLSGLAKMVFFGIVFGIFASFSFFSLRPAWEVRFREPEIRPPTSFFPPEEDEPTIHLPENPPEYEEDDEDGENGEEYENGEDENDEASDVDNENGDSQENGEDGLEEHQPPDEPIEVFVELTVEHYQEMMAGLLEIALEATKSVVLVRGIREPIDWLFSTGSIEYVVTGVIVWESEEELLVLTTDSVVSGVYQWAVTFFNERQYEATLFGQDRNLGLAVFRIPREVISDDTLANMEVADLRTRAIGRGDTVIAIGNLSGHGHQFAYGMLTAHGHVEIIQDRSFTVLATDIAASSRGTGMLFNQRGDLIGMILPDIGPIPDSPTANAIAIRYVREIIDFLLSGESIPYVGIYGYTINEQISDLLSIPMGIFVFQLVMDSPAMAAGILNGDVIVQVGETETLTMRAFQRALLEYSVGDEIVFRGRRHGAVGYEDIEFEVVLGALD